ncbi:hypothetical protein Lfu02_11030 [Longispora fulva]|uniref:Uncharacterized protein n=1 Tax=Longispora fulva TaxID=619741 RepID=A0A8J7KGK7_9ACTN|nr:hypothetical protein [Longispora fulva]MBG6135034.1 hypothetical protein [Longispora fulva]GIG56731.1 hypothetical protein Lfu02_11030 [Longispora fulva]
MRLHSAARVLVVALALVLLGTAAVGAVRTAGQAAGRVRPANANNPWHTEFVKVRSQFASGVPSGSRVTLATSVDSPYWTQRLVEIAMLEGSYVVRPGETTDYTVSLNTGNLRLTIERQR